MDTLFSIVVALLVFGALIVVHELGHFLAARAMGVDVEEFAVGMGPVLWSRKGPRTKFSVRLFPVGGFCLMKGEDAEDGTGDAAGSINSIHPLRRAVILAAGAVMNFICASVLFFVIYCISGTHATATLDAVSEDMPAYAAGVRASDTIKAIDSTPLEKWDDIPVLVARGGGGPVTVTVLRDGEELDFEVTPVFTDGAYKIGVISRRGFSLTTALYRSVADIFVCIGAVMSTLGSVFTGQASFTQTFSGPIMITAVIGQELANGLVPVLSVAAAIAVSLGFFNLIPLPALDGSRILFALLEALRGKPVSRKWEGRIHFVGLIALLALAALVALSDIAKLVG